MIINNRDWLNDNIKTIISALVLDCPLGDRPLECPLYEVSKKSDREKFEWVETLSNDEMLSYYDYHKECFINTKKMTNAISD